jgi:hypothetical protein
MSSVGRTTAIYFFLTKTFFGLINCLCYTIEIQIQAGSLIQIQAGSLIHNPHSA